ncbi:unnamed protein product [Allacma fusca]|uniref:Ionotropic receptor n=1 Tax=Allacma fusca TaxID=39272 RepID=A0A8J2PN01_9HEXA|nr:unnamed protein product [Allacma fusca]
MLVLLSLILFPPICYCGNPLALPLNIASILRNLQQCATLVFEFERVVEHSALEIPIILSTGSFLRRVWGEQVYKSRSISCSSLFATLKLDSNVSGKRKKIEYAQRLERNLFYFSYATTFDHLILIVVLNWPNPVSVVRGIIPPNWNPRFTSAIYTLVFPTGKYKKARFKNVFGWVDCKCCVGIRDISQLEFTCPSIDSCYSRMRDSFLKVTGKGKNIFWAPQLEIFKNKYDFVYSAVLPHKTPGLFSSSPFHRHNPRRLLDSVMFFLISHLNNSDIKIYQGSKCPMITYDYQTNELKQYFYVGTRNHFKFITPDHVYSVRSSFELYTKPFGLIVWVAVIGAVITVSIILERISGYHNSNPIKFARIFMKTFSTLLEQQVRVREPLKKLFHVPYIIWGTYLLMGVIITNYYKGTVKSDFTIQFPYETKWKYLEDIQGFQYFVLVEERHCRKYNLSGVVKANDYYSSNLTAGKSIRSYEFYSELRYEHWKLVQGYTIVAQRTFSDALYNYVSQRLEKVSSFIRNMFFLCELDMVEFLKGNGSHGKIAVITANEDIDYHWGFLQKAVTAVPKMELQFGSNKKIEDDQFLRNPAYFMSTKGTDELRHGVPFRLRALISSGIFNLWEKWDKIRFTNPKRVGQVGDNAKSLGFHSSNIHILFFMLLLGISCAIVIILVEIMVKTLESVSFKKGFLSRNCMRNLVLK